MYRQFENDELKMRNDKFIFTRFGREFIIFHS